MYALVGADHSGSSYGGQASDRVVHLAMTGIRLVIDEFRTDETKTLKSGQPGALRITYGEAHDPDAALKWMWRFIDGAKTAGELYGRALAVIAAEQYACRLVVPQSQRSHPTSWSSHKDRAAKSLAKLAKPHLPATLTQLEKAIDRAHAQEWDTTARQPITEAPADVDVAKPAAGEDVEEGELVDEDIAD